MSSGQLGRMFAIEARKMGCRIQTFSPDRDTPTGQIADREFVASFDDEMAVSDFARGIDLLTFEFENIPVQTVEWAARHCEVRPSGNILHIAQNRLREKEFLASHRLPLPAFARVSSLAELENAVAKIGRPSVLKSASFGYDGKGQRKIFANDDLAEIWQPFENTAAVLEQFITFEREISVIVARGLDGKMSTFPISENDHRNHILDVTLVPARISESVAKNAQEIAFTLAESLELVGLIAVEMFLLANGELLINELAPRTHNSGHYSFDACITSQFEQQLRAICGLPLGSTELLRPAAMANLLGDIWIAANGELREPDWRAALAGEAANGEVKLHLYGKSEPRKGRKMGHLTAFGSTADEAAKRVRAARMSLIPG